jgi:hypothetical protein
MSNWLLQVKMYLSDKLQIFWRKLSSIDWPKMGSIKPVHKHIGWSIGLIAALSIPIYYAVVSISWGTVWWWTWRIMLGVGIIALAGWIFKDAGRRTIAGEVVKKPWFGRTIKWVVAGSLIYFFVWPWLGKKWSEVLAASASGQQAQVARADTHADIERRAVATEASPVRVEPRGPFDRYIVGPGRYASYKVTYPSGDSTVTRIHIKGSGPFEMPVEAKWLEFRPYETDSVTFVVKQHEQR